MGENLFQVNNQHIQPKKDMNMRVENAFLVTLCKEITKGKKIIQ